MNAIERHYRLVTISERLEQLEAELLVLVETARGPEQDRLGRAAWHARRAADSAHFHASSSEDLSTMLTLSIAHVREQKQEKQRCTDVGSDVPETEKTHAANVSPFLNRQSNQFQSGE